MELTAYDIIRGPWVTSKAYQLNQNKNQLVLEVHPQANKPQIARALKKLFNVDVEKVRVTLVKGKARRAGRKTVIGKKRKKALVTLKKGQSMDFSAMGAPPEVVAPTGTL